MYWVIIQISKRIKQLTILLALLFSFSLIPDLVQAQSTIPQIDLSIGGGGSEEDDFSSAIQALVLITVLSLGQHL